MILQGQFSIISAFLMESSKESWHLYCNSLRSPAARSRPGTCDHKQSLTREGEEMTTRYGGLLVYLRLIGTQNTCVLDVDLLRGGRGGRDRKIPVPMSARRRRERDRHREPSREPQPSGRPAGRRTCRHVGRKTGLFERVGRSGELDHYPPVRVTLR